MAASLRRRWEYYVGGVVCPGCTGHLLSGLVLPCLLTTHKKQQSRTIITHDACHEEWIKWYCNDNGSKYLLNGLLYELHNISEVCSH